MIQRGGGTQPIVIPSVLPACPASDSGSDTSSPPSLPVAQLSYDQNKLPEGYKLTRELTLQKDDIVICDRGVLVHGEPHPNCLPVSLNELMVGRKIGFGAVGDVRKVVRKDDTKRVFALKTYGNEGEAKYEIEQILTRPMRSRNVVQTLNIFYRHPTIHVLMEYQNAGSIEFLIRRFAPLSTKVTAEIMRQVMNGLHALHEAGFIHRDVKPSNIVMNTHGVVKLCDFGATKQLRGAKLAYTQNIGTLLYRSPELSRNEAHSWSTDIWSAGLLSAHCALGVFPLISEDDLREAEQSGNVDTQDLENVINIFNIEIRLNAGSASVDFPFLISEVTRRCGKRPEVPDHLTELVSACMAQRPADRPSCRTLLAHEYIRQNAASEPELAKWMVEVHLKEVLGKATK